MSSMCSGQATRRLAYTADLKHDGTQNTTDTKNTTTRRARWHEEYDGTKHETRRHEGLEDTKASTRGWAETRKKTFRPLSGDLEHDGTKSRRHEEYDGTKHETRRRERREDTKGSTRVWAETREKTFWPLSADFENTPARRARWHEEYDGTKHERRTRTPRRHEGLDTRLGRDAGKNLLAVKR